MAEHTDPVDFCKGFVTGSLVGLVVAAYTRGEFRRSRNFAPAYEPLMPQPSHNFRQSTELNMRREASENAGDPTRLSPSVTTGVEAAVAQPVTIERPSGNPGPNVPAEVLEVPRRPGRTLDYSDAAQPVRSAAPHPRTLDGRQIGASIRIGEST